MITLLISYSSILLLHDVSFDSVTVLFVVGSVLFSFYFTHVFFTTVFLFGT